MGLLEDKVRARNFYRHFSKIYDRINPIFYADHMLEKVIEMAEIEERDLVLEVGCGTGFTTAGIASKVPQSGIVAVDLTPEQMRKAIQKLPYVNYIRGDAENLPFKDNTFDSAISAGSIEYWPNPKKGIAEMARVTKEGGKVVVLAPRKPDNLLVRKFAESIMLFPSTQQCVAWFEAAGLKNIRFVETGPNILWRKLVVIISGEVSE
ncbi:Methylase involved in ubiquinone/menaquinone biosynthesis [Archaeoglobus sulfaticallidus PM70-1]|uniref:Methylase involved in ubiquinone/menaquinone biosynthesis n=1 Tax=Archaeoglobus sulfaticallidus PM70-1 TaxID=387631 RepID=N0BPC8_9EURY|nr:methyltransferase domain-containing protein [Archaeoglobus sulfaticallidus]AGK62215.1 Methylase involved in ubiquinone/menaquinone biosynthesis [Archaeoglobus sulfaticallidus PM70-1]